MIVVSQLTLLQLLKQRIFYLEQAKLALEVWQESILDALSDTTNLDAWVGQAIHVLEPPLQSAVRLDLT